MRCALDATTTGPLLDIAQADSQLRRLYIEDAPRDSLFRTVLSRLGGEPRPVLLAIEDAHWADEATLDFVRYLGRREFVHSRAGHRHLPGR